MGAIAEELERKRPQSGVHPRAKTLGISGVDLRRKSHASQDGNDTTESKVPRREADGTASEWTRRVLEESGLSQEALGDASGRSRALVRKWLAGDGSAKLRDVAQWPPSARRALAAAIEPAPTAAASEQVALDNVLVALGDFVRASQLREGRARAIAVLRERVRQLEVSCR